LDGKEEGRGRKESGINGLDCVNALHGPALLSLDGNQNFKYSKALEADAMKYDRTPSSSDGRCV
jgi:hypothetical protein